MQGDFWVKNGVLGENGCAKGLLGLKWGFRGNECANGLLG